MPRRPVLVVVPVLVAAAWGCGEGPTVASVTPDPIPWTPSLEVAASSLADPIVFELVGELSDRAAADRIGALLDESRALAVAHQVGASSARVAAALEALRRDVGASDAVQADILQLVLGDVQERFVHALSTPAPTS